MKNHETELHNILPNYHIIERFEGGRSNFTYLAADNLGNKIVFRTPGSGANNFVDFFVEEKNLALITDLSITSSTIKTLPEFGIKISKYIEGENLNKDINYKNVASLLKKLHHSDIKFTKDYDHLKRLDKYEALHSNHKPEYETLKNAFLDIYNSYLKKHITYPCHNDSQPDNIIIDNDDNLFLIDWEFAANNDYIYDISTFGSRDFTLAENLLLNYEENITNEHYIRLYGWRLFQALQWFNVASYKDEIGLSKDLNLDFYEIANTYIHIAKKMLENTIKYL